MTWEEGLPSQPLPHYREEEQQADRMGRRKQEEDGQEILPTFSLYLPPR